MEFNLPHVASGDLFRDHLKRESELGKLARSYMDNGQLVPDDVTIAMVKERLSRPDCRGGTILDGFPRTLAQAEALDSILQELGHVETAKHRTISFLVHHAKCKLVIFAGENCTSVMMINLRR
jgi:adenylate kinase family enzyme